MSNMKIELRYILFLIVFCNLQFTNAFDVTTIYRLNNEVKVIDDYLVVPNAEVHIRTNALGLFQEVPFSELTSNEIQYNFPACYALRDNCTWEKKGWEISSSSPSGKISSGSYTCTAEENFECHHIEFYGLQKLGDVQIENLLWVQISQYIEADGYSYIKLVFDDPNLKYCSYNLDIDISEVFDDNDVQEIGSFSGDLYQKEVSARGNNMRLRSINHCGRTITVSYYGGTRTTYYLTGSSGYMESMHFIPYISKLCIGIGYKATNISTSNIEVKIMNKNFEKFMNLDETYNYKDYVFYTKFLADLNTEEQNSQIKIKVTVQMEDEDSCFYLNMIEKCPSDENIQKIVILDETTFPSNHSDISKDKSSDSGICVNGGVSSSDEESCICPAGFTGKFCETGCGSNRNGDDCTGECSIFLNECKGLLMCKYGISCHCAPGFKGKFCNISCSPGEYGANCENKCHNCVNGTQCDPYTGYCNSGCKKGYHSPLCYYKYQYLDVAPEVTSPTFDTITVTALFENISGLGNAKYYQIQYKENNEKFWTKGDVALISDITRSDTTDIDGLEAGVWYNFRTVLIDKDLDSYDGEDIPYATIQTKCIIPDSIDYKLESHSVTENSFKISWKYDSSNNTSSCPLSKFEIYIKEDWRWLLYWNGSDNEVQIDNLLPGKTFFIKLHLVTVNGPANSEILSVTTLDSVPGIITDLEVTISDSDRIGLKWQPPKYSTANIKDYIISYQCNLLLGCPDEDCSYMKGQFKVVMPHALISGLLPHAQYVVSVAATSVLEGPALTRKMFTEQTAPSVAPEKLKRQVHHQTNSSFTVLWKYPRSCKGLNGFFSHYEYDLVESVSEQGSYNISILNGSTRNTSVTFIGLKPHSTYYVKVYIVTTAGTNLLYPLVIEANTKAAVPGPVQNLTVYKKGRKMVGLRWALPAELRGTLKSFSISYNKRYSDDTYTSVVEPYQCPSWPHLYCHSISSLSADNEYIFTVSARNSEISEDGDQVSISALTKEEAPGVPTHLEILSQTDHSILIQWKLPHLLNGVLRSFLITIEETDSYNTTDCCQDFPLKTLTVRKEETHYTYQFTDLHSASTYTISVSAKTTVIGPAVVVTGHTKPPLVSMNGTIEVLQGNSQQSGITVKLSPVQQYVDLISGYLLLVIPQNDIILPDITEVQTKDEVLTNELLDITDDPFYIAAEFQQSNLYENPEVQLGSGSSPIIGTLAHVQDMQLTKGSKYKIGLVLVLKYCGVYNLPHVLTSAVRAN